MGIRWRDFVRLALLMRQMALDWTLSRRQRMEMHSFITSLSSVIEVELRDISNCTASASLC